MLSDYLIDQLDAIMRENVRRGIRKLDAYFQHKFWRNEIDHFTLDLYSEVECVLGQIFGCFDTGIRTLDIEDCEYFGFSCDQLADEYASRYGSEVYSMLTSIWNDEADGYIYEGMPA